LKPFIYENRTTVLLVQLFYVIQMIKGDDDCKKYPVIITYSIAPYCN